MKTHSGFTLLELMVVVSIAAIVLAVGLPGMQQFLQNNRRAAEVNNLIAALQTARSEAVARNGRIGVCSSSNGTGCTGSTTWDDGWIVFIDADDDGTRDNGEEIIRTDSAPEEMTVRATFASLDYRPNGRVETFSPAGNSGDLTFCDARGADQARVVQIDISGRPNSSHERLGGGTPSCP